jgi:hypothetical protein
MGSASDGEVYLHYKTSSLAAVLYSAAIGLGL